MKTMKNMLSMKLMSLLVMFVMVAFSSCTEDEDGVVEPTFPELKELSGEVGQTLDIAFTANVDWKLTSSAAWCKFVNGDFLETTTSGKAGDQTLKVQISDESLNYETDDVAELSLTMGDKTQVIYKITRAKKVFTDMQITDDDNNVYDAEHPIVVKGGAPGSPQQLRITVTSEFEVGLISENIPAWISLEAESNGVYDISFNENNSLGKSIKYPIGVEENFYLPFAVNLGDQTITTNIPVCYEGMNADAISFSPVYNAMHNISKNGQTITVTNQGTSVEEQVYQGKLSSTIVARNDDYEVVMFVQKGTYEEYAGMDPIFTPDPTQYELNNGTNLSWINVEKNVDEVTFSFAANPSTSDIRSALVFVLPRALYDSMKNNLMELVNDENASAYERYIILNVLQDYKVPTVSFEGYLDMGGELMKWDEIGLESDFVTKQSENTYSASGYNDYLTHGAQGIYLGMSGLTSDMSITFSDGSKGLSVVALNGKQYIQIKSGASGTVVIKKGSETIATCTMAD